MTDAPVIRTAKWTQNRARGDSYDLLSMKVCGGLHYLRGNSVPHFTLTADIYRNGLWDSGGCQHDLILQHCPDLADLAALHLSTIDGVPIHAEANGWYWLAGFFGGAGERWHGGSGTTAREAGDCLKVWADHVRLPLEKAREAAAQIAAMWNWPDMRAAHKRFCDAQLERWKAEADACIAKHNLKVFGDHWEAKARQAVNA